MEWGKAKDSPHWWRARAKQWRWPWKASWPGEILSVSVMCSALVLVPLPAAHLGGKVDFYILGVLHSCGSLTNGPHAVKSCMETRQEVNLSNDGCVSLRFNLSKSLI